MPESRQSPAVEGLAIEAVEWLPSGTDAGLVRVRGRWADPADRPAELPALCVRAGTEVRRFGSLPDVRFGRDPAVWRGSYLVPAVLVERGPEALWLVWADGREAALPAPEREGSPPPASRLPPPPPEPPGGEVIDRAVLAERRARRAEEAERAQARRAAEALQAVQALELRSAELERRLEAAPAPPPEPERDEAARAALTAALASLARLRVAAHDLRLRLRTSELQRSSDAVALASLRGELADVAALRAAVEERGVALEAATARAAAAEAEVRAAREQAAEQVAAAGRRAAADAAAVRERAAAEVRAAEDAAAAARAAAHAARAELDAATQALAGEQAAHHATRDRLEAREAELGELAAARIEAEARFAVLEHRLAELDGALAGERVRATAAATELATARAALTAANAERRAESVARAALEAQLDRERATSAARAEQALETVRAELAVERASLAGAERAHETVRAELAAERSARADAERALETVRAELAAERSARADAERAIAHALEAARGEPSAEPEALHTRIAEIERTATSADLGRHAAEQSAAAAAAARRASLKPGLAADLDAAAAALRAQSEQTADAAESSPAAPTPLTRSSSPAVSSPVTSSPAALSPAVSSPATSSPAASSPAALSPASPSTAGTGSSIPARATGDPAPAFSHRAITAGAARAVPRPAEQLALAPSSGDTAAAARPWLRSALARLAHDDPDAAARMLLALAPALRAVTDAPLDFDLTLRGSGTYAVTLGPATTDVRPLGRPRGRREAAFHATASAATLAEVVAGVRKRIGRWQGSIRVTGRRGEAVALAEAIRGARLSLAAVAGAGADLPPDVVFAAFPYAIDPAWTRGHRFIVAQQITDLPGTAFVIAARDGEPVSVSRTPPAGGPDATVSMTRATFAALLRGTPATGERRPVVRGNRAAVAALKGWTDRAQGTAR